MGFRFRKKIAPGITLNWSKRGPSLSGRVGPRGMGVSASTRGTTTASVGAGGLRYEKRTKLPQTQAQTLKSMGKIIMLMVLIGALFLAVLVLVLGTIGLAVGSDNHSHAPVSTKSHADEVYDDFVRHYDCQWLHDHLIAMKNGQVPYDRVEEHVIKTKFWGCADVVPNWKVKMR